MITTYDLAYLAASPVLASVVAYKRQRYGKYRESLPAMLGRRLPVTPLEPPGGRRCWMHSVSVGETIAAGALFREVNRRGLGWEWIATTTTETGQAQARRTLEGARVITFNPADFSWLVRRFLAAYRPSLYMFLETEIWPNTLSGCGGSGIPVFLANGKLSERSARRYAALSPVFRPPLGHVRRFFMQTQHDAERMARVVGSDSRIEVAGNVKFDALPEPLTSGERAALRQSWKVADGEVLVLAGSTHPGEEETIVDAFLAAREREPRLRLAVAPRHPERFNEVATLLGTRGLVTQRTSTGGVADDDAVVLIDEMGVLARRFGAADIALLAGSWAPVGGHNLLEPAIHGIPVLRGPHMHNQREIVRVLGPEDGAPMVEAAGLADAFVRYAQDEGLRKATGAKAAQAAGNNRGAAARVVDGVLRELG